MVKKQTGRSVTVSDLDKLAAMFKRSFDAIDTRFDGVDKQLAEINTDLTEIKGELTKVNIRLDSVDNHLEAVDSDYGPRLKRVEKHLGLAAH